MNDAHTSFFSRFARAAAAVTGKPVTFIVAVAIIVAWAASGPLFGFSDTWQLVINTGTTIITFLMVFLIQNTQNRDTEALQIKLDEIIRSTRGARKAVLDLEEMDEKQLDSIRKEYLDLAEHARHHLEKGADDLVFIKYQKGRVAGSILSVVLMASVQIVQCQAARRTTLGDFVNTRLAKRPHGNGTKLDEICRISSDALSSCIFKEYGAVFASVEAVTMPPKCIFESESELAAFHNRLRTQTETFGGVTIELQANAMDLLRRAVKDAERRGVRITPRGGKTAAARTFADTKRLWDSRFLFGLQHWIARGKISKADAGAARKMGIADQVRRVLEWESKGYYFSTGKDRTILSSVAAPGTSQHLSMLALDVAQFADPLVRQILNMHGWYQTVADDTPHFTYIGVPESELPGRGLKSVVRGGYKFWVPNV